MRRKRTRETWSTVTFSLWTFVKSISCEGSDITLLPWWCKLLWCADLEWTNFSQFSFLFDFAVLRREQKLTSMNTIVASLSQLHGALLRRKFLINLSSYRDCFLNLPVEVGGRIEDIFDCFASSGIVCCLAITLGPLGWNEWPIRGLVPFCLHQTTFSGNFF